MSTLQIQARALGDPTRHELFRYIADAARPVEVAELTEHLGLHHNAIRQHLAKLVEAGLVRKKAAWYTYGEGKKEIKFQAKDFRKVLDDMGDAAKPLIDKALEGV